MSTPDSSCISSIFSPLCLDSSIPASGFEIDSKTLDKILDSRNLTAEAREAVKQDVYSMVKTNGALFRNYEYTVDVAITRYNQENECAPLTQMPKLKK